jgi:hypothetical protein
MQRRARVEAAGKRDADFLARRKALENVQSGKRNIPCMIEKGPYPFLKPSWQKGYGPFSRRAR